MSAPVVLNKKPNLKNYDPKYQCHVVLSMNIKNPNAPSIYAPTADEFQEDVRRRLRDISGPGAGIEKIAKELVIANIENGTGLIAEDWLDGQIYISVVARRRSLWSTLKEKVVKWLHVRA